MKDLVRFKTIRVNVRGSQLAIPTYTREVFLRLDRLSEELERSPSTEEGPVLTGARKRLDAAATKDTS